ncbi:hypothetical protein AA0472_0439 [Acetobacter estunensis NRIC 0472]|uniref:Uncharacterized protein n=1 Tax=Acetobacter estunensis TaxID=104097 RepID=A0A967B5I9_9PROT|nr:hypothetical protein [Acetobacter estunensis]NHO54185.1 hypothetical protein [Acetobacter estunensis]GBQ21403.1 hypothetical protein AA0472_0439 [Acetobacter estunensis NRIC 0472]
MGFNRSARASLASLALLAGVAFVGVPQAAHAMTAKECHAKFKTAKEDGTLAGQTYKAFKAAQCGDAEAEPEDKADDKTAPADGKAAAETPAAAKKAEAPVAPVSSGNVVFPGAVSSKYSSLSAGKARMKTCLDQYHANKSTGGNGGQKWIMKGGGYYSLCVKHLKGA